MASTTIMESTLSRTIREEILPSIYELGGPKDPVYSMAKRSWTNVKRDQGIGRNYQVHKVWGLGLAGGGSFGSALGSNMLNADAWNFSAFGNPETWPGFDEVSAPTFLRSRVTLIKHKLNMFIPHDIMQSDQLNSSIGAVAPFYIKGLAKLALQQELGAFYSTAPTTVAIAGIGTTAATVTNASGDTTAINVNLGGTLAVGRIHRLHKGQLVDLYNAAGTVKRNTNFQVFVDNVDYLAQVVRLRRLDGGDLQTTTVLGGGVTYAGAGGDLDIIVLKDSLGFTPGTMESWVADGSTITTFFDIDVRDHGDFKSLRPSAISAPLTESLLNRHVGYFYESFPDAQLKRGITTMGVLLGFIDNLDSVNQGGMTSGSTNTTYPGRFKYERQGKALDVEAGWDTFNYRFGGRQLDIYTSRYMAKGRFYGGLFDLTRFVPPPVPGSKMDSRIGEEIQFLGSTGGSAYDSIFVRADYNDRFTNMLQCPAERKSVVMPGQPNFLELTGITEMTGF